MKKCLPSCKDCGENNSILMQVSSWAVILFLCINCYNVKYLKETQNEIKYVKKEKH